MKRTEIIEILNEIGVKAKADRWTENLIEMPWGIFYSAEDFYKTEVYWKDGKKITGYALGYNGNAEINEVIFPLQ